VTLALLVAAPILACAMLVAVFVSVLNRSLPAANTIQVGFPLRIVVCLAVLFLTLSGQTSRITQEIPRVLEDVRNTLIG
jgi:flagellar biosynthesis protein FliR